MSSLDNYLATKVLTASQAELNMMLNDAAVRFGRQALAVWDDNPEDPEIDRLLDRSLDAVEALVQGCAGGKTEISKQLEEQYAFCFRELAGGRLNRERKSVTSAVKLLDYHRETWRLAAEQTPATPPSSSPAIVPPVLARANPSALAGPSFSLEA